MTIVYKSNTGFTQEYAQLLGRAAGLEAVPLEQADRLPEGSEVLYMGPLMAGHITGVERAVRRFAVQAACAVGMSPPEETMLSGLSRSNYVPDGPIFYLQGGWAPKKAGWLRRRMVAMATKSLREKLQNKPARTPEEQANLDMLVKGGSFVSPQNLGPVRAWLEERKSEAEAGGCPA